MYFIEGLPKSQGFSVILVVVGRLTKFAHFMPVKHPYAASTIAQIFMDNVVKLHGLPSSIVIDRDTIFDPQQFLERTLQALQSKSSTAYHPQSDGQAERVNQCLKMYLRCSVQDAPKTWKDWLSLAELWYNSTFHTTLGCSPFKALYGYEPNIGAAPSVPPEIAPTVADVIENRELHLQALKHNLAKAQNRMKLMADQKKERLPICSG